MIASELLPSRMAKALLWLASAVVIGRGSVAVADWIVSCIAGESSRVPLSVGALSGCKLGGGVLEILSTEASTAGSVLRASTAGCISVAAESNPDGASSRVGSASTDGAAAFCGTSAVGGGIETVGKGPSMGRTAGADGLSPTGGMMAMASSMLGAVGVESASAG